MAIEIRYARAGDHARIGDILDAAFGGTAERRIVERLRADAEAMFELVALQDGELVGCIMFSRLWADSHHLYAALAPLADASAGEEFRVYPGQDAVLIEFTGDGWAGSNQAQLGVQVVDEAPADPTFTISTATAGTKTAWFPPG